MQGGDDSRLHGAPKTEDTLEDVIADHTKATVPQVLASAVHSNQLGALLSKPSNVELPSVEEVFDISPLYGCLHPGEAQSVRVTYFGHKEIRACVRAVCEVTNGPSYELNIRGEASVLCYELSGHAINFDYIPFDDVSEGFIKVGFFLWYFGSEAFSFLEASDSSVVF